MRFVVVAVLAVVVVTLGVAVASVVVVLSGHLDVYVWV